LVNQRVSSKTTVAAAAGLGNSGKTGWMAERACSKRLEERVGLAAVRRHDAQPGDGNLVVAHADLRGPDLVDQQRELGQGVDARVLVGHGDAEVVFDGKQEFGQRQRIETAGFAHRRVGVELRRFDAVLLVNQVLQFLQRTHRAMPVVLCRR
jgi:hypothetical protein